MLAGSETWTRTLAIQLKRLGHQVECYSPTLGGISAELEKAGIPCWDNMASGLAKPFSIVLEPERRFDYDIIFANHNHVVDYLRSIFPRMPIVSTIHGIMHFELDPVTKAPVMQPEHPALKAGVNQFVAVSEEVQAKLRADYNVDSVIIRNFFDTEKYSSQRAPSETPKVFFINTNYFLKDDERLTVIREVARHYGAKLAAVGLNFGSQLDFKHVLEDSDVVIGMGRSVLEGVCAGRLGIVHGRWGTGGIITKENIEALRGCNFSGRNSKGEYWTKDDFIREIDAHYNKKNFEWGRSYILREHNVIHAAEQYVSIARELTGAALNDPEENDQPIRKYGSIKKADN